MISYDGVFSRSRIPRENQPISCACHPDRAEEGMAGENQ
jgi:hypothetical protein